VANTLTLHPSGTNGCTPAPLNWKPDAQHKVAIVNHSGFEQTLSNITPGLLRAAPHGVITVPKDGCWQGTTGSHRPNPGTYTYEDGTARTIPRTGTIDPS